MQTIKQAMHDKKIMDALGQFIPKHHKDGDIPRLRHALWLELPDRNRRNYTRTELIEHALVVDGAGQYQWRGL